MADNVCGPSNDANKLVSHLDRDRSVHQDRVAGTSQTNGSATFRSHPGHVSGAENDAFHAFQHAGAAAPIGAVTGNAMMMPDPAAFAGPNGHAAFPGAFGAGAMNSMHHAHPFPDGGASDMWVNEFANMHLGPATVTHADVNDPFGPVPMVQRAQNAVGVQAPFSNNNMGPYVHQADHLGAAAHFPTQYPFQYQAQIPGMTGTAVSALAPHSTLAPALPVESSHDDEAFNIAFGEYDEDEFQRELAAWTEAHGDPEPVGPPTAEEMAQIDADLEELADELEARRAAGDPSVLPTLGPDAEARNARQQQDDLARAAMDILTSVSENRSDKFRNSSFFELMRRISVREIIVQGNDLVELATGEVVASKEAKTANGAGSDNSETEAKNDVKEKGVEDVSQNVHA